MTNETKAEKTVWSASEIHATEFEDATHVVEGLIESGTLMLLAGAPKAGKSFLSLDLALSVAGGYDFLGDHATQQGEVLYLALEDTPRRLNKRMTQMLMDDDHEHLDNLTIITDAPRLGDGGGKIIGNWINLDSIHNPQLIIVDTLFRFRPESTMGGGYRNDAMSVLWLHKLAQKGIAVLIVHHDIKSKTQSWETQIAGSKGLTGVVDGMMLLKKYRMGNNTEGFFYATSRDLEEVRLKLVRDPITAKWLKAPDQTGMEEEEFDFAPLSISEQQVQELFILSPNELITNEEVHQRTGIVEGSVKRILSTLARRGFVERVSRGMYRLAPSKIQEK